MFSFSYLLSKLWMLGRIHLTNSSTLMCRLSILSSTTLEAEQMHCCLGYITSFPTVSVIFQGHLPFMREPRCDWRPCLDATTNSYDVSRWFLLPGGVGKESAPISMAHWSEQWAGLVQAVCHGAGSDGAAFQRIAVRHLYREKNINCDKSLTALSTQMTLVCVGFSAWIKAW